MALSWVKLDNLTSGKVVGFIGAGSRMLLKKVSLPKKNVCRLNLI